MAKQKGRKPPKKIKRPELNQGVLVSPTSAINTPVDGYPIFCFKHLVKGYTLDECQKNDKVNFIGKLIYMTQKSWRQLMLDAYKSGAGFETIKKHQIKTALPTIVTEDVSTLYCIKFNTKKSRILGHKSGNIFHVTHIDVSCTAYDHS
ncbi:MAG TPA: hypothetical protein VK674_02085 [Candidatus Limnocylindria bacterium]|nr:hypothetical protein [Candidatus Limnocylindria bacterium]